MKRASNLIKKGLAAVLICITALAITACNTNGDGSEGNTVSSFSYQQGTWSDNVYTSDFLGIKLALSDNWSAASQEEIDKEKQNIINDSLSDSNASPEEIERGIEYDLKLTNDTTHSSMNIVLKDMDIIYSMVYTEEDYMNSYRQNMQQMNIGNMYITAMSDPKWVTLGGNKYYMSEMEYSYENTTTYQRIYLRKIGTYMENLTMSVVSPEEFNEIESMFIS